MNSKLKKARKIALNTETLKNLTAEEAGKVFGGAADTVELTQHRTEYLCTCGCPS